MTTNNEAAMETTKAYKVCNRNDIDTPEALGECYGETYSTYEEAESAMLDLPWDPDWGTAPELEVVEIAPPNC